jgi:hypothetical protein
MNNTDHDDPIRRAYANLMSLRANLQPGYVTDTIYYTMFDNALDQLQQAGANVSEWRIPRQSVGNLDSGEITVRIDAILTYFKVVQEKIPIGFAR